MQTECGLASASTVPELPESRQPACAEVLSESYLPRLAGVHCYCPNLLEWRSCTHRDARRVASRIGDLASTSASGRSDFGTNHAKSRSDIWTGQTRRRPGFQGRLRTVALTRHAELNVNLCMYLQ